MSILDVLPASRCSRIFSEDDNEEEDDLWDFGTVRNVARATISRANGPAMAAYAEEFDLEPSSSGPSSAYVTARSASGPALAGMREPNQPRHSVHSPPIHYAEQELQYQQNALAQARLQGGGAGVPASPKQAYRANGTGSVRRRDATVSSMSSGSSTLGRISASEIVIKGELPQSPPRGIPGAGHDRLVSQESGTLRGGAVDRSAGPPGSWQDDPEEEQDVFAERQQHARQAAEGGPSEEPEVGEVLDDRTMLDSVILPIIGSVRPFLI